MLKSDLREIVVIKLKVNLAFKYETYFKKLGGKEDNRYIIAIEKSNEKIFIALFLHRYLYFDYFEICKISKVGRYLSGLLV